MLKINYYLDDEINSIAIFPISKISLIEYFDHKIEIGLENRDKTLYYSFFNISQAEIFLKLIDKKIYQNCLVKEYLKEINYYQYTDDGSKNKIC